MFARLASLKARFSAFGTAFASIETTLRTHPGGASEPNFREGISPMKEMNWRARLIIVATSFPTCAVLIYSVVRMG
jgi:hypothetical protein